MDRVGFVGAFTIIQETAEVNKVGWCKIGWT